MKKTTMKKIKKKVFGNGNGARKNGDVTLTTEEVGMIQGIKRLSTLTVKDIIVPRIDSVFISLSRDPKEIIDDIVRSGHSRFPIYRNTIDNVVGILYVKDIIAQVSNAGDSPIDIEHVMRKPYFVPDSKRLDSLLREMKSRRVHIAIVVDEYGGVSGIVCLEDIIEEIVGEIRDEFDTEQDEIIHIRDTTYLCDARVSIIALNEKFNLTLPHDDFDTLGGFVFDLFGKIPVRYEKLTFNGADFIIQEMQGNRIESVKLVLEHPE